MSPLIGGDYAGYMAKFSPDTGARIPPLPAHLIPEELVQWGQEPTSIEVLVSEELVEQDKSMTRQTVTVLPAIACGVDNVPTTKSQDIYKNSQIFKEESHSILTLDAIKENDDILHMETIFGLPEHHRVRVSLQVKAEPDPTNERCYYKYQVLSPIQVQLERQTNPISSKGTVADHGPLDAGTVSTLIGDELKHQRSFAEGTPVSKHATWKSSQKTPKSPEGAKVIHLPGDITIVTFADQNQQDWVLQMSHFTPNVERDQENDTPQRKGSRRTIQRSLLGIKVESIQSHEEVGEYVVVQ